MTIGSNPSSLPGYTFPSDALLASEAIIRATSSYGHLLDNTHVAQTSGIGRIASAATSLLSGAYAACRLSPQPNGPVSSTILGAGDLLLGAQASWSGIDRLSCSGVFARVAQLFGSAQPATPLPIRWDKALIGTAELGLGLLHLSMGVQRCSTLLFGDSSPPLDRDGSAQLSVSGHNDRFSALKSIDSDTSFNQPGRDTITGRNLRSKTVRSASLETVAYYTQDGRVGYRAARIGTGERAAVILKTNHDPKSAFHPADIPYENTEAVTSRFDTTVTTVKTAKEICDTIDTVAEQGKPISLLQLKMHGASNRILVGVDEGGKKNYLYPSTALPCLSRLAPDAQIVLESCSTGAPSFLGFLDNMAQGIARQAPGRTVYAPTANFGHEGLELTRSGPGLAVRFHDRRFKDITSTIIR